MIPKVVLDQIKLEKERGSGNIPWGWHTHVWVFFSTQRAENTLFIRRECLASVGSFVLLLIHCLAHIAADDLHQDSSPAFLRLFYKVFITCRGLFASLTLWLMPIPQDSKCYKLWNISDQLKSHWWPLVSTAWLRFSWPNFPWQYMKNAYTSLRILERSGLPLRTASPLSVDI